ncbi:class I SAM-dependent methyltransferase [Desulfurivibrio alkaliphilus]|uniref:Methyltransferase-16, putative n=1 Tax=Desulfurivibrio alkaliphilus (strain DSM 19089 / UNIQEM U267 / AHT2) TaxID=589865 RepID=D6Z713_DESAT|nr:methyltransferase [Desulfurivibrio alkaliphilus]ADH87000.1 Methyltransferase-16, putative [Desulfurivibrio alkaliphilus AHT 2]
MPNDPVLPPQAAEILANLQKTYQVELEPWNIREHQLRLLQVSDLAPLLGDKDPFEDVAGFPFWVKVWEAALVLADFMATQAPEPQGRVLELGAGLGLPGLAAAAAGHRVTLSDFEEHILDFQRVSAAASGVEQQVEHLLLDWLSPGELPQFSTIIGAEILFREEFFSPLLEIMDRFLAPGGTIYLAHDIRRQSVSPFLTRAEKEKNFTIAISQRRMRSNDSEHTIILSRLQKK